MRGRASHFLGAANELRAAEFFVRHGWEVFFPILTQSKADFVIVKGKRTKKIQVKTVTHSRTGPYVYRQARLASSNERQHAFYREGEIDYILFIDNANGDMYLAPFADIQGLSSICFGSNNPEPRRARAKTYDVNSWKVA